MSARASILICAVLVAAGAPWLRGGLATGQAAGPTSASAPVRPAAVAVLPFAIDFKDDSATDEDYGQKVAIAIAAKWQGQKGYEVIDRYTLADAMSAGKLPRGADVDRARLADVTRKKLAADVVVIGSASGAGAVKTLRVVVIDYRQNALGRDVLDKTYKLTYPTDLRFVLEDTISAVTGQAFTHASEELAILDPASVQEWKKNPNLAPNAAFADGADGRLAQWEGVIEDKAYAPAWTAQATAPLQEDRAKMILWSPPPDDAKGKALQFAMPESVAGANGLACYSAWIEVKPGHRYRCQIVYASDGPTVLPFVKGYAAFETSGEAGPQRREVYRRQFPKLPATAGKWETATVDFVPSVLDPPKGGHRAAYDLKWVRVDLYCYWPKGHVWVKDVALKLVESPGADGHVADPMAPASRPAGKEVK